MKFLIKHEIRESILEILILNGCFILISLILGFLTTLNLDNKIVVNLLFITVFAFIAIYFTIYVFLLRNIIRTFNNNLFTSRGYLTLTIPVSINKIIISKFIVCLLWEAITIIAGIIGVLIIVGFLSFSVVELQEGLLATISSFGKNIIENPIATLLNLINILVASVLFLTSLFFVLVACNTGKIKKAKGLIGTFIYIGIIWVQEIIVAIFAKNTLYLGIDDTNTLRFHIIDSQSSIISLFSFSSYLDINNIIISIGFIFGLYFWARYLIKNKLELE